MLHSNEEVFFEIRFQNQIRFQNFFFIFLIQIWNLNYNCITLVFLGLPEMISYVYTHLIPFKQLTYTDMTCWLENSCMERYALHTQRSQYNIIGFE